MKKILTLLFLTIVSTSTLQAADHHCKRPLRIGVVGGLNLTGLENYGGGLYAIFEEAPQWHAGIAAQYNWGRFMKYSLQPELTYSVSSSDLEPVVGPIFDRITLSNIELPIHFQFGPQLSKIFRPFVQASIYPAYLIRTQSEIFESELMEASRFNFGIGAGIGFDLWKFQVQCRYRWGLTNINQGKELFDKLRASGFEFSLAIMF